MLLSVLQAEGGNRIDQIITIRPEDNEITVNFTVIDDLIALEPTESFDWTLTLGPGVDQVFTSPHNRTTIEIKDNDGKINILHVNNCGYLYVIAATMTFNPPCGVAR